MTKIETISEIKEFLEGYNQDIKYLVNVETDPSTNVAECVIHEPNKSPKIVNIKYIPFIHMKDIKIYDGVDERLIKSKKDKYGVDMVKLKTGNQKRLDEGYVYKITSTKSFNHIVHFLNDGGLHPYEKEKDKNGNLIKNERGYYSLKNRHNFFSVRLVEQFFISNRTRLYKGFNEYKNVHKLTFDIETTGLRYEISRMFAIGVRDNRGFEMILEVEKTNDDQSEIKLIIDFFYVIKYINPAIISGFNSENFDFEYILGRAKILNMDLSEITTSLKKDSPLKRRSNATLKYGGSTERYAATEMWGYSIVDTLHAAKRVAANNSEMENTKLKYLAKYEKIAKPNRTYIKGEDNSIGKFYYDNNIFLSDIKNNYIQVPDDYQVTSKKMYVLQTNKDNISKEEYKLLKNKYFTENPEFVTWLRNEAVPKKMSIFTNGKNLLKQYLLDDLWETEEVDNMYSQTSFMLAKIVPTTYQRISTMGTAGVWNLLLTAWSYENDLAIPISDEKEKFSGGLSRCYKTGYIVNMIKIDYASLYPMIQLTENVFPIFDITGVMEKMLLYLTTTRNIYKKLAISETLNNEELSLLKEIEHKTYDKHINKKMVASDLSMFKIKQLPIKTLNNSLYGALGSDVAFNWSDNISAARITCVGRIELRHAISWFNDFGCVPLYAVTDGINFKIPEKTNWVINNNETTKINTEGSPDELWKYGINMGMAALIDKFNKEEMKGYMSIDDDGRSTSCFNLSRINYASLNVSTDKITGEKKEKIKLTGNTIKSKVMPDYIKEFVNNGLKLILDGKGKEFVDYYYDYVDDIRYMQIPLMKIAAKSKIKMNLTSYKNRGVDKNGRKKAMQAHMELLLQEREQIARDLFKEHINEFILDKESRTMGDFSIEEIMVHVDKYIPPERELDSVVYYVNTGYRKSHGDSKIIKDKITGEERFCSKLISNEDLMNNPNMTGTYNYEKYLDGLNNKLISKKGMILLAGFDPDIAKKILVKIDKEGNLIKEMFTNDQLELKNHDLDDLNESMFLEELEIDFWNKSGYDPRLIWNGFKMHNNDKIHFEIYEHALNYLNEKMVSDNKSKIKSINDKREKNDMILIKNKDKFQIGVYDGTFIEIIRKDVNIPKGKYELKLDEEKRLEEEKIKNLEITPLDKTKLID